MAQLAANALPLVRPAVREVLERTPAFRQLHENKQRQLADDMVKVCAYLAAPEEIPANTLTGAVIVVPRAGLAAAVDFPAFVAELISGVFEAVVDASIQQMDAYMKLIENAARSVDAYRKHEPHDDDAAVTSAARRRLAVTRQQQLATMVLMGINRIVVTNGRIAGDTPMA